MLFFRCCYFRFCRVLFFCAVYCLHVSIVFRCSVRNEWIRSSSINLHRVVCVWCEWDRKERLMVGHKDSECILGSRCVEAIKQQVVFEMHDEFSKFAFTHTIARTHTHMHDLHRTQMWEWTFDALLLDSHWHGAFTIIVDDEAMTTDRTRTANRNFAFNSFGAASFCN